MNMRNKTSRVIHSSLSQFVNSSSNFPRSDRRIGVIARTGKVEPLSPSIQVEWEFPSFVSTVAGEYVDPDDVDGFIRKKLLELGAVCRTIAAELIEHADRLEGVAVSEEVIEEAVMMVAGDEMVDGEINEVYEDRGREEVKFSRPVSPVTRPVRPVASKTVDVDEL